VAYAEYVSARRFGASMRKRKEGFGKIDYLNAKKR
jgi:hypothetical protein